MRDTRLYSVAVGIAYHKVETGHEQNQVDQQQPVSLNRNLTLRHERCRNTTTHFRARLLTTTESLRLRQTQTEGNDQDGRARREPIQRAPSMGGSIDQATRKRSCKQITKSITLLQQTGDDTTSLGRAVLESSSSSVTVQTAHGDTEEGTAGQELLIGLAESAAQLDDDEEELVDDEGPFPAIAIRGNTEDDGANGSEHQHEGDTPGDVGDGFVKCFSQLSGGQGDGEEIEGIPSPAEEGDLQVVGQLIAYFHTVKNLVLEWHVPGRTSIVVGLTESRP